MKRVLWIIPLILLLTAGGVAVVSSGSLAAGGGSNAIGPQDYGQGNGQNSGTDLDISYAYDYLAPFGDWVNMDPYGYVWVPRHMGYRWRPYSDGRWAWTDYGWTWMDNSEWGGIPFHYGRWGMDNDIGWYWVPGTTWGPAWVTWRSNDMYMGWAPLPPGVDLRAGMDFASLRIDIPGSSWVFIDGPHFLDPDINSYVLPYERNVTIVNNTTIYNNYGFKGDRFVNDGVGMAHIRSFTGRDAPLYTIQDVQQPGRDRITGNEVQAYRPSFKSDSSARPKTFIKTDQARQDLAPAKVFEPPRQPLKDTPETIVRQRQAQEQKLLDASQAQEIKALDRQQSAQLQKVQASSERDKIQKDYQMKKSELAKQHQVEKQQMVQRHKADVEQVKRATPTKKDAPSEKNKG
jgi:hypothetical protein